jgi:hypothetical protein
MGVGEVGDCVSLVLLLLAVAKELFGVERTLTCCAGIWDLVPTLDTSSGKSITD